jgi:2-methylcitrate dehydratase PrpD
MYPIRDRPGRAETVDQTDQRTDLAGDLMAFSTGFDLAQVPAEAIQRVRDAITDTLGCMVLGARETLEPKLRAALFENLPHGDLGAEFAPERLRLLRRDGQATLALYLGTLAHAADYDDISHPAYCHATALILPALLVRGAVIGASGRDILAAHMVGVEMLGQLGRAIDKDKVPAWHPTAMLGTVGATAALCHLENLPPDVTRAALSMAASMACGVRENFGTMTKPLHCGFPGRSAILATSLAAQGFSAAERGIDGQHGMLAVYAHPGAWDPKAWGAPLEVMTHTGLALKAYPSCAATHPAIDATLALRARAGAGGVRRIDIGMSRFAMRPLIHEWPQTGLEAKFCLRYCVATALVAGTVGLSSFSAPALADPAVAAAMRLVSHRIDKLVEDDREFAAIVSITLDDGTVLTERVDVASGKPGNWLSPERLSQKFAECAGTSEAATALLAEASAIAGEATAAVLLARLAACLAEAVSPTA